MDFVRSRPRERAGAHNCAPARALGESFHVAWLGGPDDKRVRGDTDHQQTLD
jgi:hypothetical protein